MRLKDIPQNGWIFGLEHNSQINCRVHDAIFNSKDMTKLKSRIILEMTEIMTECAQVIQHANAMKDDRICTCKEKRGDKP